MRRFVYLPAVCMLALAAGFTVSDGSRATNGSRTASTDPERLDCGSTQAGSERALRQFFAILRDGNRLEIRSVLVDRPRFAWLNVQGRPRPDIYVRGRPGKAARVVARRGGLPLRIRKFMNSEPPRRTTDFGFRGRWNGTRRVVGKAAIDCTEGRATVLRVAVRRR